MIKLQTHTWIILYIMVTLNTAAVHATFDGILIDHQKLHLTATQKRIVWKIPSNMDSCTTSQFQIELMAVLGCEIEQIHTWSTNKTHITILSNELVSNNGSLMYINITAVGSLRGSACAYLDEMLHFDPFVITEQLTVNSQAEILCTNVTGSIDMTLILPNSDGEDCMCPILFLERDCYSFENCPCSTSISETASLSVCSESDSTLSICLTNITRNIQIYFVQVLLLPRCAGTFALYRKYIKAMNITLAIASDITKLIADNQVTSERVTTAHITASSIMDAKLSNFTEPDKTIINKSESDVMGYILGPSSAIIFCAVIITILCIIVSYSKMKKKNQESNVRQCATIIEMSPNECYSQVMIKKNQVSLTQNPAYQTVHLCQ